MTAGVRKVIYSSKYEVDIGGHVFPTRKYRLVRDELIERRGFQEEDFTEPAPPSDEDLARAHEVSYLEKLKHGTLTLEETMTLELPYSPELARASFLAAGGSILACRMALETGAGVHLGGGFHHAFPDHGEGFCPINDIAVGIRSVQAGGLIRRAMVVDCDVHQANGTAAIFQGDESVFTFSIHQENNYPLVKPPSGMDVGLEDGAGDEEFLGALSEHLPGLVGRVKPELIFYVAGADPYREDQLGGLGLTIEGLRKRDELVVGLARSNGIPVAVAMAGGYAARLEDTVTIHANTVEVAFRC